MLSEELIFAYFVLGATYAVACWLVYNQRSTEAIRYHCAADAFTALWAFRLIFATPVWPLALLVLTVVFLWNAAQEGRQTRTRLRNITREDG